MITQLQKLWIF